MFIYWCLFIKYDSIHSSRGCKYNSEDAHTLLLGNLHSYSVWCGDRRSRDDMDMHACMLSCFSRVWLCATPWTAAHQAPLSMGLSRQEYWSGLPFPSPWTCNSQGKHKQTISDCNRCKKAVTGLALRAISEIIVLQRENRKVAFEEVAFELWHRSLYKHTGHRQTHLCV